MAAGWVFLVTGEDASADGPLLGIEVPIPAVSHEAEISAPVDPFLAPLTVNLAHRVTFEVCTCQSSS